MRSKNSSPSKRRSLYERGGAVIAASGLGIAALQGVAVAPSAHATTTTASAESNNQAATDKAVQHEVNKLGRRINKIGSTAIPHSTERTIRLIPRHNGQTEEILTGNLGPARHDKPKNGGHYELAVTGVRDKDGNFSKVTHVNVEVDKLTTNKDPYIYQFGTQRQSAKDPDSVLVNVTYAYGTPYDGIIDNTIGTNNPYLSDYFPDISLSKFEQFSKQASHEIDDVIARGHLSKHRPELIYPHKS